MQLRQRLALGGLQATQAALLLRRHRRLLWGLASDGDGWMGDDPGFSPAPSPMPPGPLPPDDPDPGDLPDDLVIPFILLACFLVAMAGLMSGLTLGLMSLDQVDIEILRRSGTERQKQLAKRIKPVLERPHVLLVTLLVCNALAAEALPLVLDRLADPITAIVVSVTVVLLFGEIIPQAACSRYGLQIGAYSAPFVQMLMILTAPISYPIGWVLDRVLGHRHTALFRRAELKALVDIHKEGQEFGGQLSADEVAIIKGALDMTHKTARHAMTPMSMVFMLPADAVLNEATLTAIIASGHSRIPVHRPGDRDAILGIMLVKELLMVDKDAGKAVGRQKVRSLPCVRADTPLYDMLKLFEIGRSHMALLMQLKKAAALRRKQEGEEQMMAEVGSLSDDPSDNEEGDEEEGELSARPTACMEDFLFDPADFEPVGIITIEDVLEELLQAEILDETDLFVDNLQRMPVNTAFLMNRLPPHLRPVLASRSMLPRIGGADFMMASLESELLPPVAGASFGEGRGAAGGVAAAAAAAAVEAVSTPASPPAAGVADARADVKACGAAAKQPLKPGLPPWNPQATVVAAGAAAARPLLPGRGRPTSGPASGTTTPPGGGSVHAGLMYRAGSVGAALVAEALRQEIVEELAAAAGGGSLADRLTARRRTRSLSPLPDRTSRHASRASLSSPEAVVLPTGREASPPPLRGISIQQQHEQQQLEESVALFPGLRRAGSGEAVASGTSTPRLVVPLPPPPPRRSTNLSQRVQQQMDLLQPLLAMSRRTSTEEEQPNSA